jgi:uncharacterized protein YycO
MKLILCTKPGISSTFLRFAMWSKWSHSAILDGGTVTDTTLWQGGVKEHTTEEFFKHYPTYEVRDIAGSEESYAKARVWMKSQINKKYDWTALLSFIVQRDWQMDDRWFCSEYSEFVVAICDKPRFRANASRVTPGHQTMLA